jgi:hypothetical protein
MAADVSADCGGVGGSGPAVDADGEVALAGHDDRAAPGADLGQVFGEEGVADAGRECPIHTARLDCLQVRRRIANPLGAT